MHRLPLYWQVIGRGLDSLSFSQQNTLGMSSWGCNSWLWNQNICFFSTLGRFTDAMYEYIVCCIRAEVSYHSQMLSWLWTSRDENEIRIMLLDATFFTCIWYTDKLSLFFATVILRCYWWLLSCLATGLTWERAKSQGHSVKDYVKWSLTEVMRIVWLFQSVKWTWSYRKGMLIITMVFKNNFGINSSVISMLMLRYNIVIN